MENKFIDQVCEYNIIYEKLSDKQIAFKNSQDIFNYAINIWPCDYMVREAFCILLLNRANNLQGFYIVSIGGITGTVVDIKQIFKVAVNSLSSSIVIIHNHPSGNLRPSEADKSITQKIKQAAKLFDITLLDHVIIGGEASYLSFADDGIL
jgi:DNA repair protein RadC